MQIMDPDPIDRSTTQLLYLRLRDHFRREDGKIVRTRRRGDLLQDVYILEMPEVRTVKSHQRGVNKNDTSGHANVDGGNLHRELQAPKECGERDK